MSPLLRSVLVGGLAVVLSVGCSSDEKTTAPTPPDDGDSPYLDPTTPSNVLENLAIAYRLRDIDAYDAVTGEDFLFIPTMADPDILFDELSHDLDRASTENMFDLVESIEIRLDHDGDEASDLLDFPASEGYRMILVPSVTIRVLTRDGEADDPLILQVDGDPARFIFKPIDNDGRTEYEVVFQQDLHTGSGRVSDEIPELAAAY